MKMILRAKVVLPMNAPPLEDGAVVVSGDRITAVGPASEILRAHTGPVTDLGEVVLLPGLINAHCHLELTGLRGAVPWHGNFTQWLLRLVELKKTKTDAELRAATADGLHQLAATGTTTVVNI